MSAETSTPRNFAGTRQTRPGGQPDGRRQRAARTAEVVLDSAERLLQAQGAAPRVEDVAAAAQVSVRSVFNHYGSREGLLLALAERTLDALDAILAGSPDVVTSPEDRLRQVVDAYVTFCSQHPTKFSLLLTASADTPGCPAPDAARRVAVRLHELVRQLAALLAGALGRPFGDADLLRSEAELLFATIQGLLVSGQQVEPSRLAAEEVALLASRAVDNALLAAVRQVPPPPRTGRGSRTPTSTTPSPDSTSRRTGRRSVER